MALPTLDGSDLPTLSNSENTAYATRTLAAWARQHGIREVRDVLTMALQIAAKVRSAEELADALEDAAVGE